MLPRVLAEFTRCGAALANTSITSVVLLYRAAKCRGRAESRVLVVAGLALAASSAVTIGAEPA